jgi:putative membrane protein (TIGR04086 family)
MLIKFLKGLGFSFIFTLVLFLLFAIILRFSNISDSIIPGIVLIVSIISILCGASICTKDAKNQGWLWGGSIGGAYALLLYVISSFILTGFSLTATTIYLILGYILIGAIGGIIGINI